MQARGFDTLNEFFASHVGSSYFKLADLLSENDDVAAVQLEYLHASLAVGLSDRNELRSCVIRSSDSWHMLLKRDGG